MGQKIFFSKEQFKKLAIATYIGSWVINGYKVHTDNDYDHEVNKTLTYLASFAHENGLEKYVKDFEDHWLDWTNDFDTLCHKYIDEYQIENMFDELAEGLSYRDFFEKYWKYPDFRNNEDDRQKFYDIREFWDNEFEKNGIEKISIKR